jgi:putrescine importer
MSSFDRVAPSALPATPSAVGAEGSAEAVEQLEKTFHYKQELKRGLSLTMLSAYGVNWMGVMAPALIFGLLIVQSGGSVALPYALAGVAMIFTAAGYAVMVPEFPLAGSVYNYVSKGWSPYLGFLVGWIMIVDYMLFPAVATIGGAYYVAPIFPAVPFWGWIILISVITAILNLTGVELMAKLGLWILIITGAIVIFFWGVWAWAAANGIGAGAVLSIEPLRFANFGALMGATSLAALSYMGFDALTTLSEEANNPKVDIPKAVYIAVFIGGANMVITGYLGSLMTTDWASHADDMGWVASALYQATVVAAGPGFGAFYSIMFVVATIIFNVVATASAARLLYGMGRDDMIPRAVFGAINKRYGTPHWNVLIVVGLIFLFAAFLDINLIANLINYGALGGFIMLNLCVVWFYVVKGKGQAKYARGGAGFIFRYVAIPVVGAAVVAYVFMNLGTTTLIFGTSWLLLGIVYLAIRTKGFRELPPILEV